MRTSLISLQTIIVAFLVLGVLSGAVSAEPNDGWRIEPERNMHAFPVAAKGVETALSVANEISSDSSLPDPAVGNATLLHRLIGDNVPFPDRSHGPDASGMTSAFVTRDMLEMLLLAVACAAVVAVFAAFRLRTALTRFKRKWQRTETRWQRRYLPARRGEQVAQSAPTFAAAQAAYVVAQARSAMLAALRRDLAAPLAAIEGLLESWVDAPSAPAQWPQASAVRVALKTGMRLLNDALDPYNPSSAGEQPIVLDESETDLRELIDGVIALFAIPVAHKGLSLKVRLDRSADLRILVDGSRLGQIIYHLLSEALCAPSAAPAARQIEFAVCSETLGCDVQQIFFSVTRYVDRVEGAVREPASFHIGGGVSASLPDDPGSALYRLLIERMHGELTTLSDPDFGTRWTFSAPFATSLVPSSLQMSARKDNASAQIREAPAVNETAKESGEPFDTHYLDALSREGIDLPAFLRGWRRSVEEDLTQLHRLRKNGDAAGLRAGLHRLSGAVGMVGGHTLMDALQRESVAGTLLEAAALDTLVRRTRALLAQLDATVKQSGCSAPGAPCAGPRIGCNEPCGLSHSR